MNLRSVDLNLLVVLDALLDEAHVSRAATRLSLSQPATSSALERCRHLFRDPLLERGRRGMRLTPKAESLRAQLKNVLTDVTAVLDPPQVELMNLQQTVRLAMADHPAAIVVGPLHDGLAQTAPGIDLVVRPWQGASAALDALASGSIDLALSVFPAVDSSFRREELLNEHYVVLMRKGHPAAQGFDLDRWLRYPHVMVSGRGDEHGALDDALQSLGRTRRVAMVVPSVLMALPLLAGSDLIGLLPSRCVPPEAKTNFAMFAPPVEVSGFPLHLAWHVRRERDAGVQHVANIIRQFFATLPAAAPEA